MPNPCLLAVVSNDDHYFTGKEFSPDIEKAMLYGAIAEALSEHEETRHLSPSILCW